MNKKSSRNSVLLDCRKYLNEIFIIGLLIWNISDIYILFDIFDPIILITN